MKGHMLFKGIVFLLSSSVLANSIDIKSNYSYLNSVKVNDDVIEQIKGLKERNLILKTRPAFCPLNSKRRDAILGSIKNIEAVFKDDCLDNNQGTLDLLLSGAEDVQTSVNASLENDGKDKVDVVSQVDTAIEDVTGVNGQQVASLVNGMNTLFNKNKCSSLDDSSFLEHSADVIQSFSQFGLYSNSANGISVAYGGLVASSILRFINSLFDGRFEFSTDADRVTFIKLNCAYYDVRIKMQEAGIIDISTDQNYIDLAQTEKLIKQITEADKAIGENAKKILDELSKYKEAQVSSYKSEKVKFLSRIASNLSIVENKPGLPSAVQRDQILDTVELNLAQLVDSLLDYLVPNDGEKTITRQNRRLLSLLKEASIAKVSLEDDKSFNNYFQTLRYHLERAVSDIAKQKTGVAKDIESIKIRISDSEEKKYSEIVEFVNKGRIVKVKKNIADALKDLEALKARLTMLTGKKEFSSKDGEDGADLRILEANDKVKNYIYGEFGEEFISHMSKKSKKVNSMFNKQVEKFAKKYMEEKEEGKYVIIPADRLNEDQVDQACVSAKTLRENWTYAQKWAEMGYDFLSTNKDIFGETGAFLSNDREKIYEHSQSAILARRIITAMNLTKKNKIDGVEKVEVVNWQGKKLSIAEASELLKDDYKYRIGYNMLKIHTSRSANSVLQKLYGDYRCDLRANFEK